LNALAGDGGETVATPRPQERVYDFDQQPGESWTRWLPVMRVFGPSLLVLTLVIAYPRDDPGGWRGPLAIALTAILTVAFAEIWIHRPIWKYGERTLTGYSLLQVALYGLLLALSPGFAVLQVLIYPQVLFSMSLTRSVTAAMTIGVISAADTLAISNGDVRAALPSASYAIVVAFMFVAMAVVNRDAIAQSFERRALIDELTSARREAAAAERAAGVAQERARLAREIHDTLMQGFASVVTHLETVDAVLTSDPVRARAHVAAAEETARASLAEARTLVWALRPDAIAEGGLPAAIRRVALAASGPSGPSVEATVSGPARQLHTDVDVTLLRAAQESLANARRHAAATHIDLTLTYFDDVVTLDVVDDGCGFAPAQASKGGGLGLRGMRERAEGLGGTLVIESAPGEGTTVALSLPAIEAPAARGVGAGDAATGDIAAGASARLAPEEAR
jgi:signal transduction histidine kinase